MCTPKVAQRPICVSCGKQLDASRLLVGTGLCAHCQKHYGHEFVDLRGDASLRGLNRDVVQGWYD